MPIWNKSKVVKKMTKNFYLIVLFWNFFLQYCRVVIWIWWRWFKFFYNSR